MNTSKGYGCIERKVMCMPTLSVYAKCVYCLLLSYTGSKESCYPSLNTIIENLGISKPTAIKAIKELEAFKLIEVSRQVNANNVYKPLDYSEGASKRHLPVKPVKPPTQEQEVVKEVDQVVKDVYQGSKPHLPPVVKDVYPKNNIERITIKNNIKEQEKTEEAALLADASLQDENVISLFPLEEKKGKEKPLQSSAKGSPKKEKAPNPCFMPCRRAYERMNPAYLWHVKDSVAMNNVLTSISHKFKVNNGREPTEAEVISDFEYVLANLPEWYRTKNNTMSAIAGGFESIYNQLKNATSKGKSTTSPTLDQLEAVVDKFASRRGF